MNIGLDLDGCLADFNTAAIKLGNRLFGTSAPVEDPPKWDYFPLWWDEPQRTLLWMSMDEIFWSTLPSAIPYKDWQVVNQMTKKCAVYFITSRTSGNAKIWAERWLFNKGIDLPTVVVTKEKGMAARALDLAVMWDDYPQFLRDVHYYRGWKTRCYLQDHKYNQETLGTWTRISGLSELVEKEKL